MSLYSYLSIAFISLVVCSSCSNTRKLADNESLYLGSQVNIKDRETGKNERSVIKNDLQAAVRPKPNATVLGIRFKLTIYNFAGTPRKAKGLRNAIRKAGEPPVLASSFDAERNRKLLVNVLNNRGFFTPDVQVAVKTKRKKTRAYFTVTTGPQQKIRDVQFLIDSTQASKEMFTLRDKTLLKAGNSYNLEVIKAERERIDKTLKERGYYYFKPDYILVKADTEFEKHEMNLFVTIKQEEIPDVASRQFSIRDVFIYPNYRLNAQHNDTNKLTGELYKGYYVIDKRKTFKPFVFAQVMQFQPGDLYNRTDQNTSLNRLVSLGTFKFVKNRFDPVDTSAALLDVYYYLTPYPKKSIRFEAGALTQNDSRAGSQVSISWRNRNAFRGAEQLQVKLSGGFESQYSGAIRQPNTYQAGIEVSESVPRFAIPFVNIPSQSAFMPRTYVKTGYTLETRNQLFRIHSVKASYGFDWKEDIHKEHQLYPINITYVRTDTLGSTENLNLNYSNLVFNGFIVGPTYEFTYNSQAGQSRRNNFYFDGLADFSGGFAGLDKRSHYGDRPDYVVGSPFVQYIKLQTDFRYYLNLTPHQSFNNRLFIGAGIPYGSTAQLPNVKQFFSGGNSSLRGFRSRLQGPGTYNEQYLTGKRTYIELLGDMKLELNSELRTDIYQFVKGALFVDAGNVWLYNDNPNFPGGKFTTNFYRELAADAGIGLRFDFKIILLRLDLGIPIRKPWLPEGERWVFDQINFGNRDWRRDNMILNIAIGYPF